MKGKVEVFRIMDDGTSELLVSEDNLIVDGAAESIVNFLTMPTDMINEVVVQPDNTTRLFKKERVLDASNYIVQGFTTGKGLVGYQNNAHKYKKHNLITSAGMIGTPGFKYDRVNLTVSPDGKSPMDLSSDALRIIATNSEGKSYIEFSGVANQSNELSAAMDFDYLKTLFRAPLIFSVDVKLDYRNLPQKSLNEGVTPAPPVGRRVSIISMSHHGTEVSGAIQWSDALGEAFILESPQISDSNIMLKELGGGWYRAAVIAPSGTIGYAEPTNGYNSTDGTQFSFKIYPAGDDGELWYGDGVEPSGGIIISRPSVNIGSVPVNYFLGQEPVLRRSNDELEWPVLASSLPCYHFDQQNLNRVVGPYMLSSGGTLRENVSGYDPIMSLPVKQNPILSGLEPGAKTDYESHTEIDIQEDHNLNFQAFIGKSPNLTSYVTSGWQVGTAITQLDMATDARWLGCYGDGGTIKTFIVSAHTVDAYKDPIKDAQGASNTAVQRAIDINGYARAKYETLDELQGLTAAQAKPFLKCTDAGGTDPDNMYVEYDITLSKFDMVSLNIYGGVQEMGLYTLDYLGMLENYHNYNSSVDKDVDTGDDMKFKLFSRKVFNENIAATSDAPDLVGQLNDNAASIRNHSELNIKWGIQF